MFNWGCGMTDVIDTALNADNAGELSRAIFVEAGQALHTFVEKHSAGATWGTAVLELVYAVGDLDESGVITEPAKDSPRWATLPTTQELSAEGQLLDALAELGVAGVWAAWRVKTAEGADLQLKVALRTVAMTGRAA